MSNQRMPVVFVGHGSPMNALEDNQWTNTWQALGQSLPRPKAILCLSAHFTTRGLFAVSTQQPETIHDFYGFPPELFAMRYLAPGSPALAHQVVTLLGEKAQVTQEWGLDHGAWSVLCRMYPKADIPVVQLSLDLSLSFKEQLAIGAALAPLRQEGVLILGSGNVVHNLLAIAQRKDPFPWAKAFDDEVHAAMISGDKALLAQSETFTGYQQAVPTSEHFVPLLNIAGAMQQGEQVEAFNREAVYGSLFMTGYLIGAAENKTTGEI